MLSLRLEPRLELKHQLQLEIITTKPKAICPKCKHKLSRKEVADGFTNSFTDMRTTCPKCGTRFLADLLYEFGKKVKKTTKQKVTFMCVDQLFY